MKRTVKEVKERLINYIDSEVAKTFTPIEKGAYVVGVSMLENWLNNAGVQQLKSFGLIDDAGLVDCDVLERYLRDFFKGAGELTLTGYKLPIVNKYLFGGLKMSAKDVDILMNYLKR